MPTPEPRAAWRELLGGVAAVAPLLVGVAPFGVMYGALALRSGIPAGAAMAMSSLVFAGSAQFILAQLAGLSAPAAVMVATVALVNLRHALYSASVAPALAPLPRRWKALLSYLLTDEAYAAAVARLGAPGAHRHWFLLGTGATLWVSWQVSTAAGLLVGERLPKALELDFALPLTFIAIVVPMIRSRAALAAAAVAATAALAGAGLPHNLGMLAAALAGIGAGALLSRGGGGPCPPTGRGRSPSNSRRAAP